ncbi:MAG: PleD family two-component system response regulator [Bacteroidales bacterium]
MKKNKRILVIDDMSTHLLLLQSILEEEGYNVITVDNGEDALKIIEKDNNLDMILLDIMMPGIDGFEVLRRMDTSEDKEKLPIIIVSAKTDTWSIKNAMDLGAYDYITKPLNIHDIRNKVNSALNQ